MILDYIKDPHALTWLNEFKVKKLVERNSSIVTIGMARHAVRRGCRHFIKVQQEHATAAQEQIELWYGSDIMHDEAVFYADGKIFVKDKELHTVLKMLYS